MSELKDAYEKWSNKEWIDRPIESLQDKDDLIFQLCFSAGYTLGQNTRADGWLPIETIPENTAVLLWSSVFVDDDFNPSGIIEGYLEGDGNIYGAIWNASHDVWDTQLVEPEKWQHKPKPPKEGV